MVHVALLLPFLFGAPETKTLILKGCDESKEQLVRLSSGITAGRVKRKRDIEISGDLAQQLKGSKLLFSLKIRDDRVQCADVYSDVEVSLTSEQKTNLTKAISSAISDWLIGPYILNGAPVAFQGALQAKVKGNKIKIETYAQPSATGPLEVIEVRPKH